MTITICPVCGVVFDSDNKNANNNPEYPKTCPLNHHLVQQQVQLAVTLKVSANAVA